MTTTERIEALRTEAAEASDMEQVEICERALGGDKDAVAECARVLIAALAMDDEITFEDFAKHVNELAESDR